MENINNDVNSVAAANREKNKKTLTIVGIVVGVIVVLSIIGGGGNNSTSTVDTTPTTIMYQNGPNWQEWKKGFSPVYAQFMADYNQTIADLNNGDANAARSDFAALGQDAAEFSSWTSSPDDTVNNTLFNLSSSIASLAYDGVDSINNIEAGGSATQAFSDDLASVANDIDAFSNALDVANSTY